MQINRILNVLTQLSKEAITEQADVALWHLPSPNYSGYVLEVLKIEPSNNNNKEFTVEGRITKSITVGTELKSEFTPIQKEVVILQATNKDYGSMSFERTLNSYGIADNTRGFIAGVDFRANITIAKDNSEEDTEYTIKETDFNLKEEGITNETTNLNKQIRG